MPCQNIKQDGHQTSQTDIKTNNLLSSVQWTNLKFGIIILSNFNCLKSEGIVDYTQSGHSKTRLVKVLGSKS